MVEKAEKNVAKAGLEKRITIRQGNATNLPFEDKSFHAAIALLVLHHILGYERAIKEVYRVLKDRGMFVVLEFGWNKSAVFRIGSLFFPPAHWISKEELLASLKENGFKIERSRDHGFGLASIIALKQQLHELLAFN